jgi:hypothetical protein
VKIGDFVRVRDIGRSAVIRGVYIKDFSIPSSPNESTDTILVRWGDSTGITNHRCLKSSAVVVPDANLGSEELTCAQEVRRLLG